MGDDRTYRISSGTELFTEILPTPSVKLHTSKEIRLDARRFAFFSYRTCHIFAVEFLSKIIKEISKEQRDELKAMIFAGDL